MRNFSQAAANNSEPIASVLKRHIPGSATLLEIGSGAGQHALFFTSQMPALTWQPTEQGQRLADLEENIAALASGRVLTPVRLDLADSQWPTIAADHIYAANVLHIVSEQLGEALIRGAGQRLRPGGLLLLYGPFRYAGGFTSDSNANFDDWLKARDLQSGIRDFEWVSRIAAESSFDLLEDCSMPANNRMLVFRHH